MYIIYFYIDTWLPSVSDTLSVGPVEDFHFQQTDILTLNFTQVWPLCAYYNTGYKYLKWSKYS